MQIATQRARTTSPACDSYETGDQTRESDIFRHELVTDITSDKATNRNHYKTIIPFIIDFKPLIYVQK